MRRKSFLVWVATFYLLTLPTLGLAEMKGHSGMSGMGSDHGGKKMEGHDMSKMGDRVFSGKIGALHGEGRITDMKAQMAASGMKTMAEMPNSHHFALTLTDPKTNKPVTDGIGSITVTGPDKKSVKTQFMLMQGHFGADVNLPKPGKYTFLMDLQSGGRGGSATFSYTVK